MMFRKKRSIWQRMSLTQWFIVVNVVFFLIFFLIYVLQTYKGVAPDDTIFKYIALKPSLVLQGYVWTFLTSMFMHGGFGHLFVNMISLFFIGNFVERLIGRKRYFWFYMIAGIVAGLSFVIFAYIGSYFNLTNIFGSPEMFAVGASGAIFGIGGLLAVLLPKLRVYVFFVLPMPLWLAMAVMMFGLWAFSLAGNLPVGNTAHLGGLVTGLVYGFYLRKKYSRKVNMLNRMFR